MSEYLQHICYATLKLATGNLLQQGRAVNAVLLQNYWQTGGYIVEYESMAEYGSELLNRLSKDLTLESDNSFSSSNLFMIRKIFLTFPKIPTLSGQSEKRETVSHKLSWSHHFEILKADK